MVVTLNPAQVTEAVQSAEPETVAAFNHWAPVRLDYLADVFEKIVKANVGIALGIRRNDKWAGVLLGMVYPDMVSGQLQGLVCHWCMNKSSRGGAMALWWEFERVCKQRGCRAIVAGCISNNGTAQHMRKLYARLGLEPNREEFLKKI